MQTIVRPRQAGKSEDILRLAEQHFAYIVCPTYEDVQRLWQRAVDTGYDIPQPITWAEFIGRHYNGHGGVKSFVIDDLDRCVQSMSHIEIKGVSLTGDPTQRDAKQ
jgi:hypothetical protein